MLTDFDECCILYEYQCIFRRIHLLRLIAEPFTARRGVSDVPGGRGPRPAAERHSAAARMGRRGRRPLQGKRSVFQRRGGYQPPANPAPAGDRKGRPYGDTAPRTPRHPL